MKTSLCTLGVATLLSLAAFATPSAQGQTTNMDSLVISPKNSAVKVIDSSTANSLNITMVGSPTPTVQKNTAARDNRAEKIDTTVLNQKVKVEKPKQRVKASDKNSAKVADEKQKAATHAAR